MILKLTQNNATAFWNPDCGVESAYGINEHIIRNSVKNSVFSRLCHISLITFTKVLKLIEGYVRTIWNRLESVLRLLKKFCGIPSKIPCFPENLVTGKISLRIRYDSYIGIFRPFGTISEVFEKSSAERSVFSRIRAHILFSMKKPRSEVLLG